MEPVYWDEAQKAWERLCASRRRRARNGRFSSLFGFLRDLFDISGWVDSARVVVYGVLGVVWAKVWGGNFHAIILFNDNERKTAEAVVHRMVKRAVEMEGTVT
ncbi:hypothetical protein AFLA_000084, partial [Aspergillus flavus NRRL3357]